MGLFETLPTELLNIIFDELDDGDLAKLCRLNKHFAPAAQQRVYQNYPKTRRDIGALRSFIITLARKPALATLVTYVDLCQPESTKRDAPASGYLRPHDAAAWKDVVELESALRTSQRVNISDREILQPHEFSISAYLKSSHKNDQVLPIVYANWLTKLLPNVEKLRLDSDWCPTKHRDRGSNLGTRIVDWEAVRRAPNAPLSHLRSVEIVGRDSMVEVEFGMSDTGYTMEDGEFGVDYGIAINDYHEFFGSEAEGVYGSITRDRLNLTDVLQIPSLRELTLTDDVEIDTMPHLGRHTIGLTSLILQHFCIDDGAAITQVIQACRSLKNFECHGQTDNQDRTQALPFAYSVLDALRQHETSLRTLRIHLDENTDRYELPKLYDGSPRLDGWGHCRSPRVLRAFAQLRELQLDYDMLLYKGTEDYFEGYADRDTINRISDIVPPSLEKLDIRDFLNDRDVWPLDVHYPIEFDDSEEEEMNEPYPSRLIVKLAVDVPTKCPNLRKVDLHMWWREEKHRPPIEEYEQCFADMQCDFSIHHGYKGPSKAEIKRKATEEWVRQGRKGPLPS